MLNSKEIILLIRDKNVFLILGLSDFIMYNVMYRMGLFLGNRDKFRELI